VDECFFWYRLTRVVPDKGPYNGCSSSSSRTNCLDVACVFRKVEDLQFALEEMSIEKADAEVCNLCVHILYLAFFLQFVIITMRCYARAVYAVALCPSVCHKPVLYQNG